MLCAVAYVVLLLKEVIPPFFSAAPFLTYDPKDVIITLSGFILGPLAAVIISVIVSIIEMLTISNTGIIGLFMNVVSTCAFMLPAVLIYRRRHTSFGAQLGLLTGVITMTLIMDLWNYIVTPMYMADSPESIAATRSMVKGMLIPVFFPFNLIKGALNAVITFFIYKPVVTALRKAHLLENNKND
jgi:riboflavin transporter FmnP